MNRIARVTEHPSTENLCEGTKQAVHREKAHRKHELRRDSKAVSQWKHAADLAVRWMRSRAHYQDHINIATTEDISSVDCHDGKQMRTSPIAQTSHKVIAEEDLLVVNPRVDGRFANIADEGRR